MNTIMDLFKRQESKKAAIAISVGLLLSLILLMMTIVKAAGNTRVKQEITQLLNRIDYIQGVAGDNEKFSKEFDMIGGRIEIIYKKIPAAANIPEFVDQVISYVENFNLKLVSAEPAEIIKEEELPSAEFKTEETGKVKADYIKIPIEICLRGSYKNIVHYLNTLRYLPRLVTIDEISLVKAEVAGVLDIKLLVSIWYSEE